MSWSSCFLDPEFLISEALYNPSVSKENSIFLRTTTANLNSKTQLGEILQDWIRSEAENRPTAAFKWDRSVQKTAGIHGIDKVGFMDFSPLETCTQNCLQNVPFSVCHFRHEVPFKWAKIILLKHNKHTPSLWHGDIYPLTHTVTMQMRKESKNCHICITEPNISRIKGLADRKKKTLSHYLPIFFPLTKAKFMRIFKLQENSIWFSH